MTELRQALSASNGAFLGVGLFSAAVNLLMLTGPLFMLQVYDRVLASRSSATLLVLFAIVVFLFGVMGLLDHYRGRVLARIGAGFQTSLDGRVFGAILKQAAHPIMRERPAGALRDLASIQTALSSPGMGALFDLPWTPLFIAVLFLFHPWFGWFALAASLFVLVLALLTQVRTKGPQREAARLTGEAEARSEATRKAIETVRGLGMVRAMSRGWQTARDAALGATMTASDTAGALSATTKATRLVLQSAILGLGALLVLRAELTPGAMIAGSILLGRTLAPVEQLVGHWPQFQRAISAWRTDNGSAYTAKETRIFAQQLGLKSCFTPVKSPQSNGMSGAFVKTLKRDYVRINPLPNAETVLSLIADWIEDYNENHPHSGLKWKAPREVIRAKTETA